MPHNHRLQFSVEESICFQKGQEVSELLSISLDPDIRVQEVNNYVSIKGSLELTGEYNIDHNGHFEEQAAELRFVDEVKAREDGTAELLHCFPVDITIPKNKVSHLNDVFVFIDAFDYQLTDSRILTIQADLAIEGLLDETEPKEPEVPLYVAPEFAKEEFENLADHRQEEEGHGPELIIRHVPEQLSEEPEDDAVEVEAEEDEEAKEEEEAPLFREQEDEPSFLREQEDEPVSFTEPPPPSPVLHEEEPDEAEEPSFVTAERDLPVSEEEPAEAPEQQEEHFEAVPHDISLTPQEDEAENEELPVFQEKEQREELEPESEPLFRHQAEEADTEAEESAKEAAEEPEDELAPDYRAFLPEQEEEEFYSAPKLLEEEEQADEGFEIEVRKMAPSEEEQKEEPPLDLSFQFSEMPSEPEQPEPQAVQREEQEAETEQKEHENSHYLTKLFTREDEKFSRMKICIVQQQDTIERVCERYDITSQQLIRMNALSFDDELEEGQILYIPEYNNSHA
ncbi:LysM peptidoglycan-binding domain-containing protein [Bacillus nakamurai]|uniref:Morphogenetic spore protein n=1 Tax=Bacillus nakamurai TaxID=1793963 RepID=A0A150F3W2_9BACI|nr:LysM peptidoglycan-binding domain-containing protein [Bacillus nakamurai]KXZ15336.1 morphogenetic spore protein [Bacillus nakamurai]MED1226934.1 LysM peptidoglycan-binding domain-containing protein [Bacillus nakamurai]